MAKMRVHEFAKELEINSKDIIEVLIGTEFEVKSASSNIDDAAQELVRKKYRKGNASKTENKPEEIAAAQPKEKAKTEKDALKPERSLSKTQKEPKAEKSVGKRACGECACGEYARRRPQAKSTGRRTDVRRKAESVRSAESSDK